MNNLWAVLLFSLWPLSLGLVAAAFYRPEKRWLESTVVVAGGMLGLFAMAVWAIGSVWRYDGAFWFFLPLPLAVGLTLARRGTAAAWWKRGLEGMKGLSVTEGSLALACLAVWMLTLVLTLVPPTGADYDSLTYHLAAPAQYLMAGKIVELPYDHHTYFPFLFEVLYGLGLAVQGPILAKMFHWLTLPLGCLALVALGIQSGTRTGGVVAAALYATLPLVMSEATTAYIDLAFVAYVLLAALAFGRALLTPGVCAFAWSGLFCGLALGTKYLGALILGFLGIWLLAFLTRHGSTRQKWAWLGAFALPALVVGMPWYVRNVFWTGNPVYPFAFEVFGGKGWTAEMARAYTQDQQPYGFGKSLLDLVLLPWRLAMTPLNAATPFWPFDSSTRVGAQYLGVFDVPVLDVLMKIYPGPMLLALGVPALLMRGKPGTVRLCAGLFLFLWCFWALTSQQIRYLMPGLAALALVAGWGYSRWEKEWPWSRRIAVVAMAIWFFFAVAARCAQSSGDWSVVSGAVSHRDYLARTFSGYRVMEWANANTPPEAKFAIYGEPRAFYLQRKYIWADDQHNELLAYASYKSPEELYAAMRALGITHVLVNLAAARNGGAFGPPPQFATALSPARLRLLFEANGYLVMELPPA